MKANQLLKLFILIVGLTTFKVSYSQCDTIATLCDKHLTNGFISDGQDYRSLLLDDEIAEFNMTLYGNSTYRFAACSGLTDGNLIFSVYDQERNLLFTNKDYSNSAYWDFNINNTIDCIIEAQLDPNSSASGCAVLLVGFRQ
ncbi:MAG: hypothetical protein KDD29_01450 [Flavobacteriales bacterium]|nr:hypothetical protein [Flavobacteriales bacterium]MCB9334729.1 hypothetical protein [Flavobacteriales bacterium]